VVSVRSLGQGGLTDLWLDDPYVVAASKLVAWAEEANAAGEVYPVWGTCLGHQLLQILATNASFEELLVETDAVVRPRCPAGRRSRPCAPGFTLAKRHASELTRARLRARQHAGGELLFWP